MDVQVPVGGLPYESVQNTQIKSYADIMSVYSNNNYVRPLTPSMFSPHPRPQFIVYKSKAADTPYSVLPQLMNYERGPFLC